jgi:hypothetical protein
VSHLKVFGCIAYAKILDAQKIKLEAKVMKYLFFEFMKAPHLKLGRQWKVISFHMICVDRKVCYIFI